MVPNLSRNRLIAVVLASSMLLIIFVARPAATSAHISSYCGYGYSETQWVDGANWFDEYAGATGTAYKRYNHYFHPLFGSYSYGYQSTRYCGDQITPYDEEEGIPPHLQFLTQY